MNILEISGFYAEVESEHREEVALIHAAVLEAADRVGNAAFAAAVCDRSEPLDEELAA